MKKSAFCYDENYPYTLCGGNYSYYYDGTYSKAHRDRGATKGAYDDIVFSTLQITIFFVLKFL